MKFLMNIFMLSCKKASELIDKKLLVNLSKKEHVMLKMHTAMCDGCRAYQKQSKFLDKLLIKHIPSTEKTDIPQIKNDDLKQRINSKL